MLKVRLAQSFHKVSVTVRSKALHILRVETCNLEDTVESYNMLRTQELLHINRSFLGLFMLYCLWKYRCLKVIGYKERRRNRIIMCDILKRDGLSLEILERLSYKSKLGINLKKNLHYFDKTELFEEIKQINMWYDEAEELHELAVDYRIKSIQSAQLKYQRYYPDHQARKVFDDLLGFRSLCDNYEEVLQLHGYEKMRFADMSHGKANDDGYRGIHVYFQLDNSHYPIELQYNTYYDRQFNNWLHKYFYKKNYDNFVGQHLREQYENAKIQTENDFKEMLIYVLSSCETY